MHRLNKSARDMGRQFLFLRGIVGLDRLRRYESHATQAPSAFAAAQVSADGAGLVWGEVRIDAAQLWYIAAEQRAFSQAELTAWQAKTGLSNQEAAEFLGISLSAWNTYKAGTNPVPAPVAMVCRAALRDPILYQARYKTKTRGRPRKWDGHLRDDRIPDSRTGTGDHSDAGSAIAFC
ncbi:hypothetical protein MKK68_15815 [Methylobacterium sp. E-016]|uniref:hypothetical protein n=1 Tax=Methylobacterium sp. E-016 TaxID=2836556 RepID=UPI001FB909F9|nr:hypothetical protein [Methylobacterium sp. E-016]MCJ2077100.1 hypothetical protein [Methylobacterium sp. E-016]